MEVARRLVVELHSVVVVDRIEAAGRTEVAAIGGAVVALEVVQDSQLVARHTLEAAAAVRTHPADPLQAELHTVRPSFLVGYLILPAILGLRSSLVSRVSFSLPLDRREIAAGRL